MHGARPTSGPLAGIKVVDLSLGMPGAIATMLLADYGADVVKLENPSGNLLESAAAYRVWNRGKKSVALDQRQADAQSVALKIVLGADVLLGSFRPGVAERMGLDYSTVRDINPALVYCSISAFGPDGPWAQRHGYEGLVSAASGIFTDQIGVRLGPMFSSIPMASLGASLLAFQGILGSLHVRNLCGIGQKVETSMYQGAIAIRSPMLVEAD